MKIVFLLLPIALLLGGGFLVTFLVLSARGEYDDLETPAHRILLDDDE
jgi:cbb3-type cytochrome oxidase maturation protein